MTMNLLCCILKRTTEGPIVLFYLINVFYHNPTPVINPKYGNDAKKGRSFSVILTLSVPKADKSVIP